MNRALNFLKTTILGGLFFIVPLVLLILLVKHAVSIAIKVLEPIVKLLPVEKIAGVAVEYLFSVLLLIIICFLAGLALRLGPGRKINEFAERMILRKIPGFGLIKRVINEMSDIDSRKSDFQVALAQIEDAWMLSFIVEQLDNGLLVVFVPSAPTPAAGSVYYLTEARVKRLDVPLSTAMQCIVRLGSGSKELLKNYPNLKPAT